MHRSIRMILIGSLGVFFYNYFLLLGTARLKAQTAFVINELWPALIILFSCWILKEKMNPGKAAAVIFSFLGILVVTTDGNLAEFSLGDSRGVFYALMAAVCYGMYCTLNALPYLTWALALDLGNTAVIANLAYLTPFVSLLLTHFVLGEKITVFSVLGLVLIVTGIIIQMIVNKKMEASEI